MKIGTLDITNCKIGSTQVNEVRIGSTLVWQYASIDPDAQAFITAAAITNPTQITAINTLVVSLKANGIWSKMKALYPFVGGTASSHKFNLKNPLDTDAAFRLVFNGGWVHSSNGITGSVNAYADTKLLPSAHLGISSGHFSIYSRVNNTGGYDMGAISTGNIHEQSLISRWTDSRFYINYGNQTYPFVANLDARGFFITNRNSATNSTGYKNGVNVINTVQTSTGLANFSLLIGAVNQFGTPASYASRQYALASVGDGLTDIESANFYTAVQAFQTTLGRQV